MKLSNINATIKGWLLGTLAGVVISIIFTYFFTVYIFNQKNQSITEISKTKLFFDNKKP